MNHLIKSFLLFVLIISVFVLQAQTPGTKKWEFVTGSGVYSCPAIGNDGTVYVGSNDNKLYAINPDGTKKWEFTAGNSITSSPAIGSDGTIYVGSIDSKLYAIDSNGKKKWEYATGSTISSSPAIGTDGTIYIGSGDNKLYAINPGGLKKWSFQTSGTVVSSPVIGIKGTIYVGSGDKKLYAINPDGTKKWEFLTGSDILSSPAIGIDGTIYLGSNDKKVYAVNPDGIKKWEFLTGDYIYNASPAIGVDGIIYIGSWDNKLYALNSNGTKKWEFGAGNDIRKAPAIGSDGTIYVGSIDYKLYALDPDGKKKWEFRTGGYVEASPSISNEGIVYVGSGDGKIYAFYSDSKGLAAGSWPKFHKDIQSSGNSEGIIYSTNPFIAFIVGTNQGKTFDISCRKTANQVLVLTKLELDNNRFQSTLSLPYSIAADKTSFSLPLNISNPGSALHRLGFTISYTIGSEVKTYSDSLKVATFVDDNTELSIVGKRVVSTFNSCPDSSQIAKANNLGVIYRLLGYSDLAKNEFDYAVALAINQQFGFTGIKMNQGVVQSDKKNSSDATTIYSDAMSDVADKKDVSALAPQITYNQAWELYGRADYTGAEPLALQTLNHEKANAWLKAKAAALLGAIKYSKGDKNGAIEAFQMAYSLDLTGPVGAIAKENLQLITSVSDLQFREGFLVYPQPADDYIVLECNGKSVKEMNIELRNISGKVVYTGRFFPAENGFLKYIDVDDLPSGLYTMILISGSFREVHKIIIR